MFLIFPESAIACNALGCFNMVIWHSEREILICIFCITYKIHALHTQTVAAVVMH